MIASLENLSCSWKARVGTAMPRTAARPAASRGVFIVGSSPRVVAYSLLRWKFFNALVIPAWAEDIYSSIGKEGVGEVSADNKRECVLPVIMIEGACIFILNQE